MKMIYHSFNKLNKVLIGQVSNNDWIKILIIKYNIRTKDILDNKTF